MEIKNLSKLLRKKWYELMGQASYSCEMNHLMDCGEFSSSFDGDIYLDAFKEFRNLLNKYGINYEDFKTYVNKIGLKASYYQKSGGWDDIAQSIAMFEEESKYIKN